MTPGAVAAAANGRLRIVWAEGEDRIAKGTEARAALTGRTCKRAFCCDAMAGVMRACRLPLQFRQVWNTACLRASSSFRADQLWFVVRSQLVN